ncbi:TRAP transporter substrate-binding protein [Rhodobium gokarnense]|uniref:Tripartite ATP-independent transporter DctP family solute receptor n=1 Tax=Rhodobium gokarnense TaxID=364296 RepID=A0ABT3HAC5_9HYPH|nr:TRAP transporter substrate-binding protein [Rhodobium gokarnense]MCW2307348.1 tripartite ATP-independent transporter DctP family solute receptor [Rhodobium gokarnense]
MIQIRRRRFTATLGALIASAALVGAVSASSPAKAADAVTLKFSAVFPAGGQQGDGAVQLGKYLEEYSDGKIAFQFFPSSQLGNKIQSLEGLRNGSIEMTEAAATDLGNFSELWSIFALPFLFNDGADAIRVVSDPRVAKILNEDAEANGFKIIAWWNMGERSIINSKRPVNSPEDLSGIKIRVMQSPMLAKAITAMGATGVPMAWGEVYTAVQQGVIDGLENSPPVIAVNKFYEVADYYSLTQQFIIPDPQMISTKVFDSLSPELQDAVMKAGEASQKDFNAKWEKAVASDIQLLKDKGVQVNEVDKAAFRKAVQPLVDEYLASADAKTKALYDTIVTVRDGG